MSGQFHALTASPRKRAPSTHSVGGWIGPRTDLDEMEKRILIKQLFQIVTGLEIREYYRGDPLRWPHDTLYKQKLALTSPTSGDR
jgi:hypothetical protein